MDQLVQQETFEELGSISRGFHVESQSVSLEVDFGQQLLKGKTEISVQPRSATLDTFRFHSRQCKITSITVDGNIAVWKYDDPYLLTAPHPQFSIRQHHIVKSKVDDVLSGHQGEELRISKPTKSNITESEQYKALKQEASDLATSPSDTGDSSGKYVPLTVVIEFESDGIRDGLQWVGCKPGDDRWPHLYTRNSLFRGSASSLFPCLDDLNSRNPWTLSLTCPRTLGDAFRITPTAEPSAGTAEVESADGVLKDAEDTDPISDDLGLSDSEKDLELSIICSGEAIGETSDPKDQTRRICSFSIPSSVSANQLGFAIGPFEDVDLSEFRELDDDEKLGEAAIRVHGHCLPGRAPEVRNACMPLAKAIDFFTTQYTTYTGESFKLCFVDDLLQDTTETAGLSICSTRLLFPDDVIDPLPAVTRTLVNTLATQWAGIHLVPKTPNDAWAVAGIRSFITDIFLKSLSGNNEYRYQQKIACDQVYEQDLNRPSLHDLGSVLDLDPEESRFMSLKAGVVFFILDRRLVKASGSAGMTRIIGRVLNNAKADDADASYLSTTQFLALCSRMGHIKLDSFFQQWVYSAGCPRFQVMQEMNKKKLMILMTIDQTHPERSNLTQDLNPNNFLREVKEEIAGVWAGEVPPYFVGSMTIRIHESDGTPYEHIIDINKSHMKIEIPYNTKYKRMKRGRRQKERGQVSGTEDVQEDVLLYCLGDILQAEEDESAWKLQDWEPEMQQRMGDESYEWIRMDADFEWICKMGINMPSYMWISQLQQDRDVVAQMESLQWISYETSKSPHPLISTFLIRTLLDRRYFYGIRTMAAARLSNCAKSEAQWIGSFHLQKAFEELYCSHNPPMPRPNDFSDRISYIVQGAILQGLSDVRDNNGRAPIEVKRFFMNTLKFNDNSNNDFSDSCYVSTLLQCLTKTLLGSPSRSNDYADADEHVLQRDAIAEIERYRRINEWSPSFHNIFTTTALECLKQLGKEGAMKLKIEDFIRYTRSDNSDQVRLKAFDCLVDLDMQKEDLVMAYLVNEMATDPSPYIRGNLYRIFGRGLGKMAMGGDKKEKELPPSTNGLVIDQESTNAAKDSLADLQRRQTLDGALRALKTEVGESKGFQEVMWNAVKSPVLSLREVSNLLDICSILFDTEDTLRITLKLPRFWQCRNLGRGKLLFAQTGAFRQSRIDPLDWSKVKPPSEKIKLSTGIGKLPPLRLDQTPIASPRRRSSAESDRPLADFAKASAAPPTEPQKRAATILKLVKKPSTAGPSTSSAMSPPPSAVTSSTPGINGYAGTQYNGVSVTPFGFGPHNDSCSPSISTPFELQPPQSGTSTTTRPTSSGSASSRNSKKARQESGTPAPPVKTIGEHTAASAATSRAASPVKTMAKGKSPGPSKKRKSETPAPMDSQPPPPKKVGTIRLNFGKKHAG